MKLIRAFRAAQAIPTPRAQGCPVNTKKPATAITIPTSRWIQPQVVTSNSNTYSRPITKKLFSIRAAIPVTMPNRPAMTITTPAKSVRPIAQPLTCSSVRVPASGACVPGTLSDMCFLPLSSPA
jgi:hypothetical protein